MIEISNLRKVFRMGDEVIHALDRASFTIEEGDFVSIVGPSGCGKSTLMNILGLLDSPDEGQYTLEGHPVQTLSDNQRAELRNQKIGFVFQTFNLLPRASALRNVEMPLVYSASYDRSFSPVKMREMALQALDRVGLSQRVAHKPNELSGGQRQRVAIARALVNRPKLVLADEPTGNLDSKSGQDILQLFERLNSEGVTVVMVTHDPKIAERARRVIAMLDGKITEDRRRAHS
ncbi:MAG: ABC transporter ATP-binding protein [Oligoflexia bacterium]|nr:ABC transporter ATP-binding protein [Oligoflexia bacterium]